MKLEIGSGMNPQEGYVHLDIDKSFPHVEHICDISKDKLPFDDNSIEEILHSHVLEHIPWRQSPFVLKEMHRVLKPNGIMKLRTPDLSFICRSYLDKKITPEYPSDMDALKEVFGEFEESEWAIVKLFSGQDYPSNFHFCCYDFNSLKKILSRSGFSDIQQAKFEKTHSSGELQIICFKH